MPVGFEKYKTYISRLEKGEADVQLSTHSSPTYLRHITDILDVGDTYLQQKL